MTEAERTRILEIAADERCHPEIRRMLEAFTRGERYENAEQYRAMIQARVPPWWLRKHLVGGGRPERRLPDWLQQDLDNGMTGS